MVHSFAPRVMEYGQFFLWSMSFHLFKGKLNNWAIINNTSVWGLTNYFRRIIKTLIPRFSRKNRIFAELWFGKGKPHFPTFLQPFGLSLRMLYNPGKISSFQIYVHGATFVEHNRKRNFKLQEIANVILVFDSWVTLSKLGKLHLCGFFFC